jgi:tRNA pseudouridine38-40 synthase
MARYQITLAYDGTDFQGFQRQGKFRTVQSVVEAALRQLNWQGRTILAAGRTDTGVHAAGQVVAFDLDWAHSPEALGRALNASLPDDVAVKEVIVAADDFHPRYAAISRTYRYSLYCKPERDPLRERYAWKVWPRVELNLLQCAATMLPGARDFRAFGTPQRRGASTIRAVLQAQWQEQAEVVTFEITANAYLYHMVRRLVFAQVLVGQGRLGLEEFESGVIEAKDLPPGLAPAQGLVLAAVSYRLKRQEL